MKQATIELLDRLETIEWFTHVGEPVDDPSVDTVTTWKKALAESKKLHYRRVSMEAQNLLTERLCYEFPDRYHGKWNPLVEEIKLRMEPLIARKIQKVVEENSLPKDLEHQAQWDILGACMEQEYADIVPPRFFTEWVQWYLRGHFPCGWRGDFPEGGRLVVF
jgi:hypothetical protein